MVHWTLLEMSLPSSYVAYAFMEKDGPLQRIVVPWSDPKPGQVVVKVLACGVCAGYVYFYLSNPSKRWRS